MMYVLALLFAVAIATDDDPTCAKDKTADCCVFTGTVPDGFECGKGSLLMLNFKADSDCAGDPLGGACSKLGTCKAEDKTLPATCAELTAFAKENLSIDDFELGKCFSVGEDDAKVEIKVTCTDADKGSSAAALSVAAVFSGLLAML